MLDPGVATTMAAVVFAAVTGCCPDVLVCIEDNKLSLFAKLVPLVISESLFPSFTESMASALRFRPIFDYVDIRGELSM